MQRSRMLRALIEVVFAGFALGIAPRGWAASFIPLGMAPGGTNSSAWAVSGDGSVICGGGFGPLWSQALQWHLGSGGVIESGLRDTYAQGVSADGTIVVGYMPVPGGTEAFTWVHPGGLVPIGDLPGGGRYSVATKISADGSVVVGVGSGAAGGEAFRWTVSSGMIGLGDLPGGDFESTAWGVSGDGSVIVGRSHAEFGEEAFRWTASDGMIGLGDLPGGPNRSAAFAISADGTVIGGSSGSVNGLEEAFLWTASSGMVALGDLPGGPFFSRVVGLSGDGSIAVGYGRGAVDSEAFIWDEVNGMRSLRDALVDEYGLGAALAGWYLREAHAISVDGNAIVGTGYNPSGGIEAWIAFIGDTPSAVEAPLVDGVRLRGFPNPASGPIRIDLAAENRDDTFDLQVFDAGGRLIFSRSLRKGSGQTEWDTRDSAGRFVPSGVYFAKVVNSRDRSRLPRGSVTLHVVR